MKWFEYDESKDFLGTTQPFNVSEFCGKTSIDIETFSIGGSYKYYYKITIPKKVIPKKQKTKKSSKIREPQITKSKTQNRNELVQNLFISSATKNEIDTVLANYCIPDYLYDFCKMSWKEKLEVVKKISTIYNAVSTFELLCVASICKRFIKDGRIFIQFNGMSILEFFENIKYVLKFRIPYFELLKY